MTEDEFARHVKSIKDKAENNADYLKELLANPMALFKKENVNLDKISNITAEYHPHYNGVCILVTPKLETYATPAPDPDNKNAKDKYDFLDCHNF